MSMSGQSNSYHLGVATVAFPVGKAFRTPLSNLLRIMGEFSKNVYILTGNGGAIKTDPSILDNQILETFTNHDVNLLKRVLRYFFVQTRISWQIAQVTNNVGICLFFMEDNAILPMLIAKILNKKIVWMIPSNIPDQMKYADILNWFLSKLRHICRNLSNIIIVYSSSLIEEWNLTKYRDKVYIAGEHYIDLEKYGTPNPISNRNNLVGYFGRLSEEKGVLNFIQAIPATLKVKNDIEFVIGGDGPLKNEVEAYIKNNKLDRELKMLGWVSHSDLPKYLGDTKIVVLPSYTEGLPNIMLESMVCGTPVLAAAVGAIPDVISDGRTGFIMADNSPDCISANILRALNSSSLDDVGKNARALVEKQFTFDKAVERFQLVVSSIQDVKH
jgi:glycosyltransferase involved in cell wall biosynthesis